MTYLDERIFLRNGTEKTWEVLLDAGSVRLQGEAGRRFYCGLFDSPTYRRARAISLLRFPFPFGSDRTVFERTYDLPQSGRYYVVVRVGTWNPPGAEVHVLLGPEGYW